MINKKVDNVQVALEGLENGMTIMLGGFGLCGIPENSIAELVKKETTVYQIMLVLTISVLAYYCTKTNQKNDLFLCWRKMLNLNAKCLENLMWN
jgi:hypothetical protein